MTTNTSSVRQGRNDLSAFLFMVVLMALIGLITSINQQFQAPLKSAFLAQAGSLENTFATFLTFSFFLAYLVMGPTGAKYLQRKGYKNTLLLGTAIVMSSLAIFELSALSYQWLAHSPSLSSWNAIPVGGDIHLPIGYFFFLIGSFVSGMGLTYLQASVNPYIIVCSVPKTTGVTRQNIAGTANSLMGTLGPIFMGYVLFKGKEGAEVEVTSIVLPLLILILLVGALFIGIKRTRLPELTPEANDADTPLEHSVYKFKHLRLGVIAIFMYVGCEVCIGSNIIHYAQQDFGLSYAQVVTWSSLYWLSMLIGRFLSSFLTMIKANTQLLVTTLTAAILVALAMILKEPRILIAVGLLHSLMWGAIFSLAIDKLGKYTTRASGALLMGVIGGAVMPFLQGVLADFGNSWNWTWLLVVIGELYMLYYAIDGYKPKPIQQNRVSENEK